MVDVLPIRLAAWSGPTFGVDDLACAAATFLGCWEAEGLDVTWTPVHGGVAAMQAVLDDVVDVSYGGLGAKKVPYKSHVTIFFDHDGGENGLFHYL